MKGVFVSAVMLLTVGLAGCTTAGGTATYASAWAGAVRNGDTGAVVELFAPDATLTDPITGTIRGSDAIRSAYRRLFDSGTVEVQSPISEDDRAAIQWTWRGVDPATGRAFAVDGVSVLTISPAGITHEAAFYDPAATPYSLRG